MDHAARWRVWRAPLIVALLAVGSAAKAWAQCPDGTPPPCAVRLSRPAALAAVPPAQERARRFVVLPFRNVTRRPDQEWLVEGSTTMLVQSLSRWKGISVVPDEKLYPTLRRVGAGIGGIVDPPKVRRIAEETGGWTAVTGEVIATGDRIRVSARAWDVPTNRELVRASGEVSATGDVRLAFDSLSMRLLRSAGLDSVTPELLASTSQNLDAYRAYLQGLSHSRRGELRKATEAYERAVRADSAFALAWAELATSVLAGDPLSIIQAGSKASVYAARAVGLSSALPPRRRQLVQATDLALRAQFTDVRRILEGLYAADSTDVEAIVALSGLESFDPILQPVGRGVRPRGSLTRAVELTKRAVLLDPGRKALYGQLATFYAGAALPNGPPAAIGVSRSVASMQELLQAVRDPGQVRAYYSLLQGDSLALVPSESLSFIPKDSVRARRQAARAAARGWVERWIAVSTGESSPYPLAAELASYDGDQAAALRYVAVAESLGVQQPQWKAAARRLLFHAKGGNRDAASRLADSLTSAGFFKIPNNQIFNDDATSWAFALHLVAGRFAAAEAMLEGRIVAVRFLNSDCPTPTLCALRSLGGNLDPEDEPRIPRAFRRQTLDAMATRVRDVVAFPKLGATLSVLLPALAQASDSARPPWDVVIAAADTLAAHGQPRLAFDMAANAEREDSTLRPRLVAYPWYRRGAEAMADARAKVLARVRAGQSRLLADRAVFEWQVDDSAPFPRYQSETPPSRAEYTWSLTLTAEGRAYELSTAAGGKDPTASPTTTTLSELVSGKAARLVLTGRADTAGAMKDTTLVAGVTFATEVAPGVLRMVVTDETLLAWLRRTRPAAVRYRFYPCAEPIDRPKQCVDTTVPITYP